MLTAHSKRQGFPKLRLCVQVPSCPLHIALGKWGSWKWCKNNDILATATAVINFPSSLTLAGVLYWDS